jgi:3-hydroxyacyl-CoA dehydrogenase
MLLCMHAWMHLCLFECVSLSRLKSVLSCLRVCVHLGFHLNFLHYSRDRIVKSLDKLVEKQKMTMEYANTTLGRIEFTTDMDALKDVDLIVEAVIENMTLKEELYTKLGKLCQPKTIFASNTSSLSIGEMAAFSGRPDKFVGVHFFNPVQVRTKGDF